MKHKIFPTTFNLARRISHLEYRRNICKPKGGNSNYDYIQYT